MSKDLNLVVKGGKPSYGEIFVSDDPFIAVVFIANFIASRRESIVLSNLPRVEYVMNFISILESLKIRVEWISITEIKVSIGRDMVTDFSNIPQEFNHYLKILVPALLIREKQVDLNAPQMRYLKEEVTFYDNIGVIITYNLNRSAFLRVPLDISKLTTVHLSIIDTDLFTCASRLILAQTFTNMRISLNQSDPKIGRISQTFNTVAHVANIPSTLEFNFFACLSIVTDGEAEFKNFDLSISLPFLLKLVELGANYEVIDGKLKFWYEHKGFENQYIYDHISLDELGYILLIVSTYTYHNVKFRIPKKVNLDDLTRELNIIGCKIDNYPITKGRTEYNEIIIKPSKTITVKGQFETSNNLDIDMVVLSAAFINEGKSKISAIDYIN